jgi:hypothetical protein
MVPPKKPHWVWRILLFTALVSAPACNHGRLLHIKTPSTATAEARFKKEPEPLPGVDTIAECTDEAVWPDAPSATTEGARFENLSAPSINAYFGRKKTDPDAGLLGGVLRTLGRDWVPVAEPSEWDKDWYPKKMLCGHVDRAGLYENKEFPNEHDWNILIVPGEGYRHLLAVQDSPGLLPRGKGCTSGERIAEMSTLRVLAQYGILSAFGNCIELSPAVIKKNLLVTELDGWLSKTGAQCDVNSGKDCIVEAEVTAPPRLREAFAQRFGETGFGGRKACVYGAWVAEALHFSRPEIHPAEALWWRETSKEGQWVTNGIATMDTSGRFDFSDPTGWITPRYWPKTIPRLKADAWVWNVLDGRYFFSLDVPVARLDEVRFHTVEAEALAPIQGGGNSVSVPLSLGEAFHICSPHKDVRLTVVRACRAGQNVRAVLAADFRLQNAPWKDDLEWQHVQRGHLWLQLVQPAPEQSEQTH